MKATDWKKMRDDLGIVGSYMIGFASSHKDSDGDPWHAWMRINRHVRMQERREESARALAAFATKPLELLANQQGYRVMWRWPE